MNTSAEIRSAAVWLNQYWDEGNTIVPEEVYEKELLPHVTLSVLLNLGMKMVKSPTRTFLEYPQREITEEKIEKIIRRFRETYR